MKPRIEIDGPTLEKWGQQLSVRVAAMLDEFARDDMKIACEVFDKEFVDKLVAKDLLSLGVYMSLVAGCTVADVTALAEVIAEQRAAKPGGDLLEDEGDGA